MRKQYVHRTMALFLVVCLLSVLVPMNTVSADAAWTGIYLASDNVTIDKALKEQVQLFSQELAAKVTGSALPISYGPAAKAGESDIVLVLDAGSGIADQGYQITVSGTQVTITASDDDGLFYGCRKLIKQWLIDGKVSKASSAPDVLERAISLDNGRKYYTVNWIKELIREMSWSEMNALVLHFSEEMGLGIESKTYPWLNGRDGSLCVAAEIASDNRYLTQEEVAEIVVYANKYHVEIIPAFDSPGHMNYIVKKFNEKCATADYSFTYNNKTYTAEAGSEIGNYYHVGDEVHIVEGSRNTAYSRGIDISNEVAVAFTRSLIEEYGKLFADLGCTKFDIGGDELLGWGDDLSTLAKWKQLEHWEKYAETRTGNTAAVGYDGFLLYMNDLYDLVSGMGYTSVRVWNDDVLRAEDTGWKQAVTLNKSIEILYWTPTADSSTNTVSTYINAGHDVHNYINYYNYFVLGKAEPYGGANQKAIYTEWSPYVFASGGSDSLSIGNSSVKGSAFCIWADNPAAETEDDVMSAVLPMIRANGAKAWDADANSSVSYSKFTANLTKLGDAPDATVDAPDFPDSSALQAAIKAYDAEDAGNYTEESFAAYTEAVNAAKELLANGAVSQAALDTALANITTAKQALENVLIQAAGFRPNRVRVGGKAVLLLVTQERPTTIELRENGTSVSNVTTVYMAREAGAEYYYIYLTFPVSTAGTHSYELNVDGVSKTVGLIAWEATN